MQTNAEAACAANAASGDPAVDAVPHALMTTGRLMRQRLTGDSVDVGTFWLLKGLATHGALRVTELAALANLDASTVSRHVQQLHRSGLIERFQDPDDGRAQRVALSAAGTELLNESITRRRSLLRRSFEGWDQVDVESLGRLLTRFVSNIENLSVELEQV
jgi:DNA-binding MarR family transcriptional regulator